MWYFFREREVPYNLRKGAVFFHYRARLTTHGINYAHFRGTLNWNQLPSSIKSSKSIIESKTNLQIFGNIDYGCVILRKYSFSLLIL